MKVSPRSYPGDGVLDVLVFKGPKSDSFTLLPKLYRGEHIPHDHIEEFRVKQHAHDRGRPTAADRSRRRGARRDDRRPFDVVPHAIRMKL